MKLVTRRLLAPFAALACCIGIAVATNYSKQQPTGNVVETPATAAMPLPRQPTAFGVNLFTADYWTNERSFMNLAAGGAWRSINGSWTDLDPRRVDRNGTVMSLRPGESVALALTRPAASHRGDIAVRCIYEGQGAVAGVGMADLKLSPGRLDFIWQRGTDNAHFRINATDPGNPIRNIDCREPGADPKALFDPGFVASLKPYKSIRFMDWQRSNANAAGSWSQRTLPTATIQAGPQGVAIEHMVALANQAKFDPWFVMPWKAEPAYIENFARYVHDHLDPARTVYLEVGNEIWNLDFPAARQALDEGAAMKLGDTEEQRRMRRYAQRSVEVFKVWERVYAKEPQRLVRVMSGQNSWPDLILNALDYRDTARHVDALASALYFGQDLLAKPPADTSDVSRIFPGLFASIETTFESARRLKQYADARGLRFIGYEGGQHVGYDGPDKTLSARLNRDPRMGEAFRIFLSQWDREFGDLLLVYHLTSPIGQSASFGLAEYSGQPLSETPKRKAVLDAIAATKR